MPKILIIDDEQSICEFLTIMLSREGYSTSYATDPKKGLCMVKNDFYDLAIVDVKMPEIDGIEVLRSIKSISPKTIIIIITAFASTKTAVCAIKEGAYDYLTKPFKNNREIEIVIQNALKRKKQPPKYKPEDIIGKSPKMLEIFSLIKKISEKCSTVLINGESGTGKELVAKAIHFSSTRSTGPFVSINCGAIQETLLESEMFGHTKGSFTGAINDKKGLFEIAHSGTLFLDEIGNAPLSIQVKLLRVLQEKQIRRVGSTENIKIDVRLIAATNSNLEEMIDRGQFREDLFYRLNVIPITIPPLRERREDIPLLSNHFLKIYSSQNNNGPHELDKDTISVLKRYQWPGNVRELENIIERSVALGNSETIMPSDLPDNITYQHQMYTQNTTEDTIDKPKIDDSIDLESLIEDLEKKYIMLALEKAGGNKTKAAELLNLSFRSFRYRIKKLNLQ